jgi:hypothetical protein
MVYVNDNPVRLFHPSKLTVGDALLGAGLVLRELQGTVGKGFTVYVNGTLQIIRGTFGTHAKLYVGDQAASLQTPIKHRDQIRVTPGGGGGDAKASVADVAPQAVETLTITLNGISQTLYPLTTVNGELAPPEQPLHDNDQVVVRPLRTVEDVLLRTGCEEPGGLQVIRYSVDGSPRTHRRPRHRILLNGVVAGVDSPVKGGDQLVVEEALRLTLAQVAGTIRKEMLRVLINGKLTELAVEPPEVLIGGRPASPDHEVQEGEVITLLHGSDRPLFAHILARTEIAAAPPPGKTRLLMHLNGVPAEFVTPVRDGDSVELIWE